MKTFPKRLAGKGKKQILDEPKTGFPLQNGQPYYKEYRLVTADKDRQVEDRLIHKGAGDTSHSKAVSAHLVRYEKMDARFF